MDWMDDYIEAQWGLYIGYMRETLDYTITIIPFDYYTLNKAAANHGGWGKEKNEEATWCVWRRRQGERKDLNLTWLWFHVRNNMDWMDDYIEAQWGLYIGYMRETLNYTITIIPSTIIPLTASFSKFFMNPMNMLLTNLSIQI
jgi:hypothetical protein